ncbi:MAG TPA: 50S ribosomal protein L4 [Tissierellia bacterium]|nr:50S ribosomal protein L4 [Tissierellia bacterium]
MPTIKMRNQLGNEVESVELSDSIFGIEPNVHVMHEAVVNYLANQRQGTFAAKTRADVRGGGRKPFRQKGTGRARQGSTTSPNQIGGGVVFAKKPRDFSYSLPKKIRRLALKSALSQKVLDEELILVDKLELENGKTKEMVTILSAFEADKKPLIVLGDKNVAVERAARNLPNAKVIYTNNINTYQILNHQNLILTKDALDLIEEVYK